MNKMLLDSESSSGSESGWTLYLDQSLLSPRPSHSNTQFVDERGNFYRGEKQSGKTEDEEENLSMVSDASSGPPLFHEDESCDNYETGFLHQAAIDATLVKKSGKREKNRGNRKVEEEHPSFLDDTASSPIFNFAQSNFTLTNKEASMENVRDFSQGFSATHFEGKSAFYEPFGFFQSSLPANQLQQQNQWGLGGRWG